MRKKILQTGWRKKEVLLGHIFAFIPWNIIVRHPLYPWAVKFKHYSHTFELIKPKHVQTIFISFKELNNGHDRLIVRMSGSQLDNVTVPFYSHDGFNVKTSSSLYGNFLFHFGQRKSKQWTLWNRRPPVHFDIWSMPGSRCLDYGVCLALNTSVQRQTFRLLYRQAFTFPLGLLTRFI